MLHPSLFLYVDFLRSRTFLSILNIEARNTACIENQVEQISTGVQPARE